MTTAGQDSQVTAGIYCRMSLAVMDDTTKVDDQERIGREVANRRGWTVADGCGHPRKDGVYTDNNRSAWQRNRKRPAWDQMLKDVEAGKINAIVVYHGDRLIRQPYDLEVLINLAYGKGVKLASPTGDRDLSKSDDLYIVRIESAGQCRESDRTSERRKAQYARWRREGRVRPGGRGGRSYGFATDGLTQVPAECDHIREMAAMLLAGEPTGALVRDAAARGALTPAGRPFTHGTIRKMLARARYAGLMPDGENKAAWEPVLDRETWERVRDVLDGKAATFASATNARRWLLSGIAVCGACGAVMQLRPSKGRGRQEYANGYGCTGCRKAYRSAPHLDAYVSAAVLARLANPLNPAAQVPDAPDMAAEWEALAAERAQTEKAAKDYRTSPGRLDILMGRLDGIDARMAELRELAAGDGRSRLLERYAGMTREDWEDEDKTPLTVKRALVAACFTVVVLPAGKRGPGFRTEDVRLEPLS